MDNEIAMRICENDRDNEHTDIAQEEDSVEDRAIQEHLPKKDCPHCEGTGKTTVPNGQDDFDYEECSCTH